MNGLIGEKNTDTGWVGAGWNFELGRIALDDDYSITVNGVSEELIMGEEIDGEVQYHTKHQTFMHIKRSVSGQYLRKLTANGRKVNSVFQWEVKDKEGNQYLFGFGNGDEGAVLSYRENGTRYKVFKLYGVTDVHGNTLNIRYDKKSAGGSYPKFICYTTNEAAGDNHAEYVIEFFVEEKGYDAQSESKYGDGGHKLIKIKEWYYPYNGTGTQNNPCDVSIPLDEVSPQDDLGLELIRQLDFGYDTDDEEETNILEKITIKGDEEGSSLPPMTFEYEEYQIGMSWKDIICAKYNPDHYCDRPDIIVHHDRPFLVAATNSYGGEVQFEYQTEPWSHKKLYQVVAERTVIDHLTGLETIYQYRYDYPNLVPQGKKVKVRHYGRFYGFGKAKMVNLEGTTSYHYFDNSSTHGDPGILNGYELSQWLYGPNGELYTAAETTWRTAQHDDWPEDVKFVYAESQKQYQCHGQSGGQNVLPCLINRGSSEYDIQYGNVLRQVEYNADAVTGYRFVDREFVSDSNNRIFKPSIERTYNGDGSQLLAEQRYIYDEQGPNGINSDGTNFLTKGIAKAVRQRASIEDDTFIDVLYQSDEYGNVTHQTTYNAFGTINIYASGEAIETYTTYDTEHNMLPVQMTNPLGYSSHTEYDFRLQAPVLETDPNGFQTAYKYDSFGRLDNVKQRRCEADTELETVFAAEYHDTAYTENQLPYSEKATQYIENCVPVEGEDPVTTISTQVFYDGLGRKIQAHSPDDDGQVVVAAVQYDKLGRLAAEAVPYAGMTFGSYQAPDWANLYTTATMYNPVGQPLMVLAPDGTTARMEYYLENSGQHTHADRSATLSFDGNNHQKQHISDIRCNLIQVRELVGQDPYALYATTHYSYDIRGNLVQVQDSKWNMITIEYNFLGRKTNMNDPDMGEWWYDYDVFGNLTSQTDAQGVVTRFEYDILNHLTDKSFEIPAESGMLSAGNASYFYDEGGKDAHAIGQRTRMIDVGGQASWDYDFRGQVINTTLSSYSFGTFGMQYQYDSVGRVKSVTYPDGEVVEDEYTLRSLPSSLTAGSNILVDNVVYDHLARLETLQTGNGLQTDYDYYLPDQQGGRLHSKQVTNIASSEHWLDLSYEYDPVGNISLLDDRSTDIGQQTAGFEYDHLDRLTSAGVITNISAVPSYSHTYKYDEIGNIMLKDDTFYDYRSDTPHAVTNFGEDKFMYDANGNMTVRYENNSNDIYLHIWNTENKLAQVIKDPHAPNLQGMTFFVYDGDGNRLMRLIGEETTLYIGNVYEKRLHTPFDETNFGDVQTISLNSAADFQHDNTRRDGVDRYSTPGHLQLTRMSDDFTDDSLNPDRWWLDNNAPMIESVAFLKPIDGRLEQPYTSTWHGVNQFGEWLTGDFTATVEYGVPQLSEQVSPRVGMGFNCQHGDSAYIQFALDHYTSTADNLYRIESTFNYSDNLKVVISKTNASEWQTGAFQVVRDIKYSGVGTAHIHTWRLYHQVAGTSEWTQVNQQTKAIHREFEACRLGLYAFQDYTEPNKKYQAYFDNLTIQQVDGILDSDYVSQGTWQTIIEGAAINQWQGITLTTGLVPTETVMTLKVRSCPRQEDDSFCGIWQTKEITGVGGALELNPEVVGYYHYLQVELELTSDDNHQLSPTVNGLDISYRPFDLDNLTGELPTSFGDVQTQTWTTQADFIEQGSTSAGVDRYTTPDSLQLVQLSDNFDDNSGNPDQWQALPGIDWAEFEEISQRLYHPYTTTNYTLQTKEEWLTGDFTTTVDYGMLQWTDDVSPRLNFYVICQPNEYGLAAIQFGTTNIYTSTGINNYGIASWFYNDKDPSWKDITQTDANSWTEGQFQISRHLDTYPVVGTVSYWKLQHKASISSSWQIVNTASLTDTHGDCVVGMMGYQWYGDPPAYPYQNYEAYFDNLEVSQNDSVLNPTYINNGTWQSEFDGGDLTAWDSVSWQGTGTAVTMRARSCPLSHDDEGCGEWLESDLAVGETLPLSSTDVGIQRYLQIELELKSDSQKILTPQVDELVLNYRQAELTDQTRKYYYFGSQRVAMREGNEVYYLHGDHLGTTSLTAKQECVSSVCFPTIHSQRRHHPYGLERWSHGMSPTDFGFNAQREESFGMQDYIGRFYHAGIGRFASADVIVPDFSNPQNLNRYMYVLGNPLRFVDPTGHCVEGEGNCERD